MNDPQSEKNDVNRMLLQADLYEQQGLYDHAMQVYKNILSKEPENSEAKERGSEDSRNSENGGHHCQARAHH